MTKPEEKIDWVNIKAKLEMEPIIGKWLQFNKLDVQTQQRIWDEWKVYYEQCRESSLGKLSREMADAYGRNDLPTVDGLKRLNKDLSGQYEVNKPKSSMDPMEFFHDQQVYLYKRALIEIERGKAKLSF